MHFGRTTSTDKAQEVRRPACSLSLAYYGSDYHHQTTTTAHAVSSTIPLPTPLLSSPCFLFPLSFRVQHCIELYLHCIGRHPPHAFLSHLYLSLICLSCVMTSICPSLLAIICDSNSVIHSCGKTLKWHLFSALPFNWATLVAGMFNRYNLAKVGCKISNQSECGRERNLIISCIL